MEQKKLAKGQSSLSKSPLIRNKQRNEHEALQKMYLLTEPAFKKVKESLDGEKVLTEFEKSIKSVLYNKKMAPYLKWLKYKDLVIRFATFKKFLEESKLAKDDESTQKLLRLEKRINELENSKTTDLKNDELRYN